jgi:perosamine synthetase
MHKGLASDPIPVSGPWITQKEIDYVSDAAANAWYSNANIYNERFEKAFADYLNVKFAITLPSCTSAIHLSLLALGVGQGDEVIAPDITWIGSAAPISYVSAIPVFADIDSQTWCLSTESFRECITPNTKAVIPVDLYGNLPNMTQIRKIADQHGIAVLEDAAEAIGSEFKGKKAGSFGDTGVFSFHGSKTLTTGEGGMMVTDREDLYERALFLRDHGRKSGDKLFRNLEIAFKYKMSSMQAALGLAQLERVEELVRKKRKIFSWYDKELSDHEYVAINHENPKTKNTYWMVTAIISKELNLNKTRLIELMREKGIDCRPFFHPLSSLPAYSNLKNSKDAKKRNSNSYRISPYGINLPSGMNMTEEKTKYVCNELKSILKAESK